MKPQLYIIFSSSLFFLTLIFLSKNSTEAIDTIKLDQGVLTEISLLPSSNSSISFAPLTEDHIESTSTCLKDDEVYATSSQWALAIGGTKADWVKSVQQIDDGSYLVAGGTYSFATGSTDDFDAWLLKLDEFGNVIWQKTFGGDDVDTVENLLQTNDGGYIIQAFSGSFGDVDTWILKFDANDTVIWQKQYDFPFGQIGGFISETSDGGYIFANTTVTPISDPLTLLVYKIDNSGNVVWDNLYSGTGGASSPIIQTNDGGYLVADAPRLSGEGSNDLRILNLDANGNNLWKKAIGGVSDEYIHDIKETVDGGYIFTGYTDSFGAGDNDVWILKLDKNGNIIWQKTYGGTDRDAAYDLQLTSDGGFVIAANTKSFGAGDNDVWILKLDENGNIIWQKTYGGTDSDSAHSLQLTEDGGYIIAGQTNSFGNDEGDAWILKLDPNGDISNCGIMGEGNPIVLTSPVTTTNSFPITFQQAGVDPRNTYVISQNSFASSELLCEAEFNLCADLNDDDKDGLPNGWEICGYDHEGDGLIDVNLHAMGADPKIKDIFVEVDYMMGFSTCNEGLCVIDHTHIPHRDAIKRVVDAFERQGIHLHVDYGPEAILRWGEAETWGDLSRGGWIPHEGYDDNEENYLSSSTEPFSWDLYRRIKLENFTAPRRQIFHYSIFAHFLGGIDYEELGDPRSRGGKGLFPGSDFVVTLGLYSNQRGTPTEQAAVFMHELGHNLSLDHGGQDSVNYKPNYLSVMNPLFTYHGLIYDSGDEGDSGWIDYSIQETVADPLIENNLDEPSGLTINGGSFPSEYGTRWWCKPLLREWGVADVSNANVDINWDCQFGSNGENVTADINYSGVATETLHSYEDWNKLTFGNGCIQSLQDANCIFYSVPLQVTGLDNSISIDSLDDEPRNLFSPPYSVSFEQSSKLIVSPGLSKTIPLTLTNTGQYTTTVSINQTLTGDWFDTTNIPISVTIVPSTSVSFNLDLSVPNLTDAGEIQMLSLEALPDESPRMKDILEIVIHSGALAWFSAEPVFGNSPLTVSFTDLSIGEIINWYWNFGDGAISTQQNPTHTYKSPGLYTVSLDVTSLNGKVTYSLTDLVMVEANQIFLPVIFK